MRVKYFLISIVLASIIFCSAWFVEARAVDNSALIAQIQAQIAQLTAQLQVMLATQQGTTQTWCHTFNQNLGFANSGSSEVVSLHTALQKQNISYGLDNATTYDEGTSSAVIQFQARYGITPQSGYVGPLTREKLNSLYGCGQTTPTTQTTTTCTSFNYSSWSACSPSGVQTRMPTSYYPGCTSGTPVLYQSCSYNSYCTESDWISTLNPSTCPSSGQQTRTWTKIGTCDGGIIHPASEIVSCNPQIATCTSFNYSDWGVCSAFGTQTRTVKSSLPVGCASGNQVLSQSCTYAPPCTELNWTSIMSPVTCPPSGQQTRAWTYRKTPESYFGSLRGVDCKGGVTHPASEIVSCNYENFLNIIYPNGGETLHLGGSYDIKWDSRGFSTDLVVFKLYKYNFQGDSNPQCIENMTFSKNSLVLIANKSWRWSISPKLSPFENSDCEGTLAPFGKGLYKVWAFRLPGPYEFSNPNNLMTKLHEGRWGLEKLDESDNYFTISDHEQPLLELLYPSGGEEWKLGQKYTIRWMDRKIPSTKTWENPVTEADGFKIILADESGKMWYLQNQDYNTGNYYDVRADVGQFTFVLDTFEPGQRNSPVYITPGKYKIIIAAHSIYDYAIGCRYIPNYTHLINSNTSTAVDESDYFSIVSGNTNQESSPPIISPKQSITVISPNPEKTILFSPPSGGNWGEFAIEWTSAGNPKIPYVKIDLYRSGKLLRTIAKKVTNNGWYGTPLIVGLEPGNDYKIRISKYGDDSVYGENNLYLWVNTPYKK